MKPDTFYYKTCPPIANVPINFPCDCKAVKIEKDGTTFEACEVHAKLIKSLSMPYTSPNITSAGVVLSNLELSGLREPE